MRDIFLTGLAFFTLLPIGVYAGERSMVRIAEVMPNPEGRDTGFEYLVLENYGAQPVDLEGWNVYPDGIGYYVFPAGALLGPGARITLRLNQDGVDTTSDFYFPAAQRNMGNTNGSIALFSGPERSTATLIDFLQYGKAGQTWESAAGKLGLWKSGSFVSLPDSSEGHYLQRKNGTPGVASWAIIVPKKTPVSASTVRAVLTEKTTAQEPTTGPQMEVFPAPIQLVAVSDMGNSVFMLNGALLGLSIGGGLFFGIGFLALRKFLGRSQINLFRKLDH